MSNKAVVPAAVGTKRRYITNLVPVAYRRIGILLPILFIALLLVAIVLTSLFWQFEYSEITSEINSPPSRSHPFGTDAVGRDMLARTMAATSQSLLIAVVVTGLGMTVGVMVGVLSGYFGGYADTVLMRFTDLAMTIPLVAIAGFLANLNLNLPGPKWLQMGVILSIVIWTSPARLIRGVTLTIRSQEFVEVARSYSIRPFRIIFTHIITNVMSQILVAASIMLAVAILAESGLSFIGLGIQPPGVSLGVLVAEGQASAFTSPWLFYPSGVLILAVALCANFFADTLRGIIDPKGREIGGIGLHRVQNNPQERFDDRSVQGQCADGVANASEDVLRNRLLTVQNLSVDLDNGPSLLKDVSFSLYKGETVAIVGESGAGKSTLANALVGALPQNAKSSGSVSLGEMELLGRGFRQFRKIRGSRVGFIQQDPMTFLNPTMRVGTQLREALGVTRKGRSWRKHIISWLLRVGITHPDRRIEAYPHELSGGMKQRVGITMALQGGPDLVIADEPTTALDATVQADVVSVLKEQIAAIGSSLIFVTHNMGVVAGLADRVIVLYGGRIVEVGDVYEVFREPLMPYTAALLRSVPRLDKIGESLKGIPGESRGASALLNVKECPFAERCPSRFDKCAVAPPLFEVEGGRRSACWLSEPEGSGDEFGEEES